MTHLESLLLAGRSDHEDALAEQSRPLTSLYSELFMLMTCLPVAPTLSSIVFSGLLDILLANTSDPLSCSQ